MAKQTQAKKPWHEQFKSEIAKGTFNDYYFVPEWDQWYSTTNVGLEGQCYPWLAEIGFTTIRKHLRDMWTTIMDSDYSESAVRECKIILEEELAIHPEDLNLDNYVFMNGIYITKENTFREINPIIFEGYYKAIWGFKFDYTIETEIPNPDNLPNEDGFVDEDLPEFVSNTPTWDKWLHDNPEIGWKYELMWRCILHRDFSSQLTFHCLGPSGSGKSTLNFAILEHLEDITAPIDLETMEGSFGYEALDKMLILYEDDLEPGYLSKRLTKEFKKNANINKKRRINEKNKKHRTVDLAFFYIIVENQMNRISQMENVRIPIYRRSWITEFNHVFAGNSKAYSQLVKEAPFMICQWLSLPYNPGDIMKGRDLMKHANQIKEVWEKSSMPAYWWVLHNCCYVKERILHADTLIEKLDNYFKEIGSDLPDQSTLMADIGNAIQSLKGRKRQYMLDGRKQTEYQNISLVENAHIKGYSIKAAENLSECVETEIMNLLTTQPNVRLTKVLACKKFKDFGKPDCIINALDSLVEKNQIVVIQDRYYLVSSLLNEEEVAQL